MAKVSLLAACFAFLVPVMASLPLCRVLYGSVSAAWRNCTVEIGGLGITGKADYDKTFGPTFGDYLTQRLNATLGLEFKSMYLDFNQNFEYVEGKRVDLIYSNPGAYACLMVEFGLVTVASMVNFRTRPLDRFAGVMFTRANSSIYDMDDLRTASIEGVSISGLGGFQLQQGELLSRGFDVMTHAKRLIFAYDQALIVKDVETGYADVGFVRTDMIDRSVVANKTKWEYFRILFEVPDAAFPFKRSTGFTPEWPVGALPHVPYEIMKEISNELCRISRDSAVTQLKAPAISGSYATWVMPMNYLGLLNLLSDIGYYNKKTKKCLRSEDVYAAAVCPPGYVKQAKDKTFCTTGCKPGYDCLCKPCTKLEDPALELASALLPTQWAGSVDTNIVASTTTTAASCLRMEKCIEAVVGQNVQWILLDRIGSAVRIQINAPLVNSVQMKFGINDAWKTMSRENTTLNGLPTERYVLNFTAAARGTHVVQIQVDNQQAEMSPIVVVHNEVPRRTIVCPSGHRETEDGTCEPCLPGTYGAVEVIGGRASAVCRPCAVGSYRNVTMPGDGCELAPIGSFVSFFGSTAAELCPAGSYSARTGLVICALCNRGGFFQSAKGQTQCDRCAQGSYAEPGADATTCTDCPAGRTTESTASDAASDCVCPTGQYESSIRASQCSLCPEAIKCDAGSKEAAMPIQGAAALGTCPVVEEGFMTLASQKMIPYKCRPANMCPGGGAASCAQNRDPIAVACGRCLADHYSGGDGKCHKCSAGQNAAFWVLAIVGCMVGLTALASALGGSFVFQSRSAALAMIVSGLVLNIFQTMAVFEEMTVYWPAPLEGILEDLAFFTFNVDVLNTECITGQSSLGFFILRQCVVPICILYTLIVMTVKGFISKDKKDFLAIGVNGIGATYQALFVPMVLSVVAPFICYFHPGDAGSSMVSVPALLCFEDEEHLAMVGVSIAAFILCVMPYLVLVTWAICRNRRALSDSSLAQRHIVMFRFLFSRFKPEACWFGSVSFARSLFACLVPVVIHDSPAAQVVVMAIVLSAYCMVQLFTHPWRASMANLLDGLMSFFLLMLLFCSHLGAVADDSSKAVGTIGAIMFILCLIILAAVIARATYFHFVPKTEFSYFMCHHKADAAGMARYLQICLQQQSGKRCFLDSDHLVDLDTLFDTVRCKVGRLCVIMTKDVLRRPWCAGEITVTYLTHRRILSVIPADYATPLAQFEEEELGSYLSVGDFKLTEYGIDDSSVVKAFNWLTFEVQERIAIPIGVAGRQKFEVVAEYILGQTSPSGRNIKKIESGCRSSRPLQTTVSRGIVVSTLPNHDESTACAGILVSLIQEQVTSLVSGEIFVLEDRGGVPSLEVAKDLVAKSKALVVLMSEGSLTSPPQVTLITNAVASKSTLVLMNLPGFRFPTPAFYAGTACTIPSLDPNLTTPDAGALIRAAFKLIAVPFPSSASIVALEAQGRALLAQFRTLWAASPRRVSLMMEDEKTSPRRVSLMMEDEHTSPRRVSSMMEDEHN